MKTQPMLNFLVFTCFLVIGYTFSIRFYQPGNPIFTVTVNGETSESQKAIDTMQNGQRSILLITATSINTTNPHLESIWLATYLSSDTAIQLLPIFPDGNKLASSFELELNRSFDIQAVDDNLSLDPGFINVLKEHNYWWSGYILLDEVSLAKAFNLLGGIELNGRTLTGTQVLQSLPVSADDPQNAYSTQIAILQSVCHKILRTPAGLDVSQIISLLPNHILTDLDSSQLQTELDSLNSGEHTLTCRFPTLEVTRIEP